MVFGQQLRTRSTTLLMSFLSSTVVIYSLVLLLTQLSNGDVTPGEFYGNVADADLPLSFEKIKNVPIKLFEFLYDSVPGRVQMGVLVSDAQRYIPEAIDVHPSMTFPGKVKSDPPVVIKNFQSVDKNAIFVHGVAALKELIARYEMIEEEISKLEEREKEQSKAFENIYKNLQADATETEKEQKKVAIAELLLAEKQVELEKGREEAERELVDLRLSNERSLKEYEAELTTQRLKQEEQKAQNDMQKLIEMERDLALKKEQIRMETSEKIRAAQKESDLALEKQKLEREKEKIKVEIELKAEQERANEDMNIRRIKLEAELSSQATIAAISAFGEEISKLVLAIISEPQQLAIIGGIVLLFIFAYYALREIISVLRTAIQAAIGRPSLVRETSMHWHFLPKFIADLLPSESYARSLQEIEAKFIDVVLGKDDRDRVIQLAVTTRNTKMTSAPFRHVLLHGPPGTGKTLIARKLAECSGMDYAIMSGGDVGPLGDDAVNQLHSLFKWAESSRRGLLVFIDESEAFLSSRNATKSEDSTLRHALNALLYQTGTPSQQFMLVLATNRPQDLDSAILDRVDVSMKIGLPEEEQRQALVRLYLNKLVVKMAMEENKKRGWFNTKKKWIIDDECMTNETVSTIAEKIEGFSGREISKLMITVRYKLTMNPTCTLTRDMVDQVVREKLHEHEEKVEFRILEERERESRSKPTTPVSSSRSRLPPERQPPGKLSELDLKLARRMKMNGEDVPGIVHLNM